jgi:hypothetical protein
MAYAQLGEDSNAIASSKRARSLDPNLGAAPDARRALAELQVP